MTISARDYPELGEILWLRDYDLAMEKARQTQLPVLLLFHQALGCSTYVARSQTYLTHPLIVECIREHFIPVAVCKSREGKDAGNLRQLNEQSWNNPAAYFLTPDGAPIVDKLAGRYDPLSLYESLRGVFGNLRRDMPKYFDLLHGDLLIDAGFSTRVCFETPCFWSGETSLAQVPGVIATNGGWIDGNEIVEVHFDPSKGSIFELEAIARDQLFSPAHGGRFEVDEMPQYYLSKTNYRFLPLTRSQRTKINWAIPYRSEPEQFLSPSQRAWRSNGSLEDSINAHLYTEDIRDAWAIAAVRHCLP